MRVGAQDCSDPLSLDCTQNCFNMPLAVNVRRITNALAASGWSGVNYRNIFARADQPCLRARICVRRRIGSKNAADQRFMLFGFACANAVGPTHETDMAHCGKKKRGAVQENRPGRTK